MSSFVWIYFTSTKNLSFYRYHLDFALFIDIHMFARSAGIRIRAIWRFTDGSNKSEGMCLDILCLCSNMSACSSVKVMWPEGHRIAFTLSRIFHPRIHMLSAHSSISWLHLPHIIAIFTSIFFYFIYCQYENLIFLYVQPTMIFWIDFFWFNE